MRRLIVLLSVTVLLLAGQQPVHAAGGYRTLARASWAYIDLRTPSTSYVDGTGDAPVGLWHDPGGGWHLSKSYFTFDLSGLRGTSIKSATVATRETDANSCRTERAVELWRTGDFTAPTWISQPQEITKAGDSYPADCLADVFWEATAAITAAVDAGEPRITFALRVPDTRMLDLHYGRRYSSNARLTVRYNTIPDVPAELTAAPGGPCGPEPLYVNAVPVVSARLTDGDGENVAMQVAFWPLADPAARVELPPSGFVASGLVTQAFLPADRFTDGNAYAWQARTTDGEDVSPWSQPCLFHTDFTRPATIPTVFSAEYPERVPSGGVGVTGTFVLNANGDTDIVRFYYTDPLARPFWVDADRPGGIGTFQWTPTSSGFGKRFTVYGVDRAGNLSDPRYYSIWVASAG